MQCRTNIEGTVLKTLRCSLSPPGGEGSICDLNIDSSPGSDRHDLPPSTIAKPLPVNQHSSIPSKKTTSSTPRQRQVGRKGQDVKDGYQKDDTPKAFTRLLQLRSKGRYPSGLDDGSTNRTKNKKRKHDIADDGPATTTGQPEVGRLRILAGEKMSEFATRVNAALPLSGVAKRGGRSKDVAGLKPNQTRLERKMQKMQREWRKEEERIQAKRIEQWEDRDDDDHDADLAGPEKFKKPGRRKGKRRRVSRGATEDDHDDPWEVVRLARGEPRRSLHDVVQAPPKFTHRTFRVTDGARIEVKNIPKTAGSLRRREELGLARESVVEGYRRMMSGKGEANIQIQGAT